MCCIFMSLFVIVLIVFCVMNWFGVGLMFLMGLVCYCGSEG